VRAAAMSALGQQRTSSVSLRMSALGQQQTFAADISDVRCESEIELVARAARRRLWANSGHAQAPLNALPSD
jgi:hypothetical protein